jgi:short subunit fatty acids transporter
MQNLRPRTLLLVLISVVPVIVALAFVVAILLERAGFGLVIWALVPFAASMTLIWVLGVVLGRATVRRASEGRRSGEDDGV